ncbi:TetR/AcrR family transcriptional regulator [Streptomyces meridianus]|uniref:TetR family transcriptional regulator n=1 Tax=Streptomyces meridianus TaxID=2938945 RepID=A0ABT0X6P6_9ACTN|nr:TetR/AcrR family transcriptional regulator [Streptomyces meridianus]MCM2578201.1 TetR family transcriptional regulator [Streptomyces meridianus]
MGPVNTSSDEPHPPTLRRVPVQRRSAERLGRILDACAEVLDETGYETLSTRAVAARAGVPIGSVYRFFGNKRAMADALARRNLDTYVERVSDGLADAEPLAWHRAIDVVVDAYIAMKRDTPGFALLDFQGSAPADAPESANRMVADRLGLLLAGHLGREADATWHRTVLVGVEAADALLQLAFRTDPSGDPEIVAETKALLRAYLARVLG